jgi:AmiR/NasT family two-component response regulator
MASTNPISILICEDEQIAALDLKERVEHLGHRVIGVVETPHEALAVSRKEKPDLVLMDVFLHGHSSGLEAAQQLEETLHIPSIFISGSSDRAVLERAQRAHPLAYLVKPFRDNELKLAIEFGMDNHRVVTSLQRDLGLYQALFEREEQIEGPKIESGEVLRDVVGAVAHELSSTLVTMMTELSWLVESSTLQALERRSARGVLRLCEDSHRLIQRLLWASQEGPRELSVVLVSELVHEVSERIKNWVKPIKGVEIAFERDDLVVFCDRKAVVNALIGAIISIDHARHSPGTISISVGRKEPVVSGEGDQVILREEPGSFVVLSLHCPVTELAYRDLESMTKTFAPEHIVPQHVGLGLAVAYGVVRAHGGWMEVKSSKESGTTVQLFLPEVQAH